MKFRKIKKYLLILMAVIAGFSCNDDFLDRSPLDASSEETYFTKSSDLESYMNGLYGAVIRNVSGNRWTALSGASDDLVTFSPNGALNKRSATGQAPETSGTWNNGFTNIREVNYFLVNSHKVSPLDDIAKHYIGEAYYSRAYIYFNLLRSFGDIPHIGDVLETDSEDLYKARDSRDYVATQIIADLDSAIVNLSWKGIGAAVAARINKEAALVLKTRVGLYEGSWEKYHGEKNTPFAVSGNDGSAFLQAAVEAGEMLIDKQGTNIYIGGPEWEYSQLFTLHDYKNTAGAYLYKVYDPGFSLIHDWHGYDVSGWYAGLTKELLDQYLMTDGKPASISAVGFDEKKMNSVVENKDPRLGQCVWNPAKGKFSELFAGTLAQHNYSTTMPGLIINQQRYPTPTGYRIWKGTIFDASEWRNGKTDDLIIRYGEGLLNYIEAKAILGSVTQTDIDKTVNVLRNRVGMTPMNLGDINGWGVTYNAKDGYDVGAPNILNEIRRERRVELLMEGFRADDIKRWALMDEVFNNTKPTGAHLKEFLDYWNDADTLLADGFKYNPPELVTLTVGVDIDTFENGFINPFWQHADFNINGEGYYIDPTRDYLNAIPSQEITIYESKGGVTLEQNPGWF
ncbi:MAG: RagB/SusD family nutrient uptake outer membrane protein [Draconibacterium sp.]|nr:RagB/SusD family nutrient uptake outer membrane protein [Draconibacterium sp.]